MFSFKHVSEFRRVRAELKSLELDNEIRKRDTKLLELDVRLDIYRPVYER